MVSGAPAGRRKKMQQSEFEDKQDFKMTAAYESEPKGLLQCQLKGHSAGRTSLGSSRLADLPSSSHQERILQLPTIVHAKRTMLVPA